MLKKILFQLHWLLGISAGLVLALMGLTVDTPIPPEVMEEIVRAVGMKRARAIVL